MTPDLVVLYCPTCARDGFAEAPPCCDGHGDQCPDRACVECGTALMFDAGIVQLIRLDTRTLPGRRADAGRAA